MMSFKSQPDLHGLMLATCGTQNPIIIKVSHLTVGTAQWRQRPLDSLPVTASTTAKMRLAVVPNFSLVIVLNATPMHDLSTAHAQLPIINKPLPSLARSWFQGHTKDSSST